MSFAVDVINYLNLNSHRDIWMILLTELLVEVQVNRKVAGIQALSADSEVVKELDVREFNSS